MNVNIITYTGKIFDLLNPQPEQVCIEDIAHSLAHQCRYTGHTRKFYSVAQHCILMAEDSDLPGDPMQKLMHDVAETYIGDIAKPWKQLLQVNISGKNHCFPHFNRFVPVKEFEQSIQDVIGLALGIDLSHSAEVKEADVRMMATEIRDLMPLMPSYSIWSVEDNPVKGIIVPWAPNWAEHRFLSVYYKLKEITSKC